MSYLFNGAASIIIDIHCLSSWQATRPFFVSIRASIYTGSHKFRHHFIAYCQKTQLLYDFNVVFLRYETLHTHTHTHIHVVTHANCAQDIADHTSDHSHWSQGSLTITPTELPENFTVGFLWGKLRNQSCWVMNFPVLWQFSKTIKSYTWQP